MKQQTPRNIEVQRKQELLNRIAPGLLTWYDKSRRSLPWREEPTPYRVWVSEIMLQQTRVEAVKPYFARFMERLPDIEALAEVDDDELLKLWEGLGYYSRARNLKAAAQQIVTEYGGEMPSDYRELLKLKGIGSYTAGAVSSIAFKQPNPAVDGNVLRVIARLLEDDSDISDQSVKKRVEDDLRPVMPKDRPGDFNQALMELGATVCLPNGAPKCSNCPWQEFCLVGLHGTWQQYPQKAAKKARTIEDKTILVIRTSRQVVLRKRPKKGLLAGLYEFPAMDKKASLEEVREWLKKQGGLQAMKEYNEKKAKILYDFLDQSKLFKGTVVPEDRSLMNVPFVTGDADLDAKFVKEATEAGFVNLKGHRTVGGMRASIYNAMPKEGVEKLVEFMKKFEEENA